MKFRVHTEGWIFDLNLIVLGILYAVIAYLAITGQNINSILPNGG